MPDSPNKSPARASGAKALTQHLLQAMAQGRLREGVKLPPERELSASFQTSRGSVRRVLADLKDRGLITQVVGSGTFVTAAAGELRSAEHPDLLGARNTSPAELMEARLLIEPLMPGLIVRHATAADFAHMAHCLAQAEAATSIESFEHWDGELHKAFAEATHNAFFLQILALTNQVREQGEWGRLKAKSLTPERRAQYERQHRDIVSALRDRDAGQARALLAGHLEQIQRNLFDV